MEHSFLYFLGSALIPILRADVAAGASCHVHLVLIVVAALRTGPHKLAVNFKEKLPPLDVKVYYIQKNVQQGDDYSFYRVGIPTVWLKSLAPYVMVHTAADVIDFVSFERMEEYTRVYADMFRQLCEGKYE